MSVLPTSATRETHPSFEVIRGAISSESAVAIGQRILALYEEDSRHEFGAFYFPPFGIGEFHRIARTSVKQYHEQPGKINRYIDDARHGALVQDLLELDEHLTTTTDFSSDEAILQLYFHGEMMPEHRDLQRNGVQSLNLLGEATVRLPEIGLEPVTLMPGDLAIFRKQVLHSVRNVGEGMRVAFSRY